MPSSGKLQATGSITRLDPGYEGGPGVRGVGGGGAWVLGDWLLGYESISAGVRGDTRGLVPGVRGDTRGLGSKGMKVLDPGYEGIISRV